MGSAHARILYRIANEYPDLLELRYIVDIDYARAKNAAKRYGAKPLQSINDLPEIDLAIIATPTKTHLQAYKQLASKATAFLVEKPMTPSLEEAAEMIKLAEKHGHIVAVGHIERFNPAVRELHRRLAQGALGEILTIIARRVGPYAPRAGDIDVVYDLAVHEIDNLLAITNELPRSIKSYTLEGLVSGLTDYALIVLGYRDSITSIEVNRITPFKQRHLYLTTRKETIYLDYMEQELRIHRGTEEARATIRHEEPLYLEDLDAAKAAQENKPPMVDIYQGFTSIYLCQLALESRKQGTDIDPGNNQLYQEYQDLVEKGLEGYKNYREKLAKEEQQ